MTKLTSGPPVAGSYYPYEWKVDDKKGGKQQARGGGMATVNLSTVDMKHVTQVPIQQNISQQNAWGGTGASVVASGSPGINVREAKL